MIALIIGIVSMIFIFMMWGKGDDVIKTDVAAQGMTIEPLFTITYALFVISVATIIFFVIRMWVKNPKEFMGSLVYIGGFVLVVLIGYLLMDNSPVMLSKGDFSSAADAGLADFGLSAFSADEPLLNLCIKLVGQPIIFPFCLMRRK